MAMVAFNQVRDAGLAAPRYSAGRARVFLKASRSTRTISSDVLAAGGIIACETIYDLLEGSRLLDQMGRELRYTRRQCVFVIEAMRQFRLLFAMADDPNVVVPALLNISQPENNFVRSRALAFRVRFEGFMPSHVLPSLIVERSHEIHEKQVWRFGCRLVSLSTEADAFIQADEHARTLTIWCAGANANEYLAVLRDKVVQSLGKMSHLRFAEEILLDPSQLTNRETLQQPTWESYTQIRAQLRRHRLQPDFSFVATNEDQYDLNQISEIVPKRRSSMRILFLASNPVTTSRLDVESELRRLEMELSGTRFRDNITLVPRHAVQPDDLVRYIRADRPSVVHFAGHGTPGGGILLRDDGEELIEVRASPLRQLFEGRGIKLLVLNACYTETRAEEILGAVETIIGTTREVGDVEARRFTIAFYRTLGNGGSIGEAFRDGRDSVVLYGSKDVFASLGNLDARPFQLLDA